VKIINLQKKIVNIATGKEIKDGDKRSLLVKDVLAVCAQTGFEGMKPIDNARAYSLAKLIHKAKNDNVDINTEMFEVLKKSIEANRNGYLPLVLGQALIESGIEVI